MTAKIIHMLVCWPNFCYVGYHKEQWLRPYLPYAITLLISIHLGPYSDPDRPRYSLAIRNSWVLGIGTIPSICMTS